MMNSLFDLIPSNVPYPFRTYGKCPIYRGTISLRIQEDSMRHVNPRDKSNLLVWHYCHYCKNSHMFEVQISDMKSMPIVNNLLKMSIKEDTVYITEYIWNCPHCGQIYKDSSMGSYVRCKRCQKMLPDIYSMINGDDEDKLLYHRYGADDEQ